MPSQAGVYVATAYASFGATLRRRVRALLKIVVGLLACGLVVVPAGAEAQTKKKRKPVLTLASASSKAPRTVAVGRRITVRGIVRNDSRRARPALVSVVLRRSVRGRNRHAIGATRIARVKPRKRRGFRIVARVPALPAGVAKRRFVIVACVRPSRGARASCKRSRRSILIVPSGGTGSGGTGNGNGTGNGGGDGTGNGGNGTGGGPAPDGTRFTPGARTRGDRLFPQIGNGGYDVTHYELDLNYAPDTELLGGSTRIDATATQNLSEFSLDLHEMPATGVTVNGAPATFKQQPGKLIVTLPAGIPNGSAFSTTVTYAGTIAAYIDPDGSEEGWVPTSDGAFVVNEPVGAMSWFPNDNVPSDKATYDMRVTVPAGRKVLANGVLVAKQPAAETGPQTWHWRSTSPMASYLTTATNGAFDLTNEEAKPGLPAIYAVDSTYNLLQKQQMLERLRETPAVLTYLEGFLKTPYPFESVGGVVDKSSVGYALESQTRPMYANSSSLDSTSPSVDVISHEIAHQWFGNSVSPATWSDIWLNEGPAEFLSWLWAERSGSNPMTTEQRFTTNYNNPAMSWETPPAQPPTAADLFDVDAMYVRGAMVFEALRQIMGEPKFAALLATYQARFRYGDISTAQFIALVKAESGLSAARLDEFFEQWLYTSYETGSKPTITPDNF